MISGIYRLPMNRRTILKQLAIATGGLITLPAWMGCGAADTISTHLSSFSTSEQQILAAITDTIIPAGSPIAVNPGALSVGVDKFLQKLFDDCYDKKVQDNIKVQLKVLDSTARSSYKNSFPDCVQAQRQELLSKLSGSNDKSQNDFFTLIKTETIRGFNTSQEVMQNYLGYKLAPGHYHGCVDIKA
jgi:hypothetical protein